VYCTVHVAHEEDIHVIILQFCVTYNDGYNVCCGYKNVEWYSTCQFMNQHCPTNEHLLFAWRIYGHKKLVCIVQQKISVKTFLKWCVISFWKIWTVTCRNCVIVCTTRADESHFGNLVMVSYRTESTIFTQPIKIKCLASLYMPSHNSFLCTSRSASKVTYCKMKCKLSLKTDH
jgi:hypothetical protein